MWWVRAGLLTGLLVGRGGAGRGCGSALAAAAVVIKAKRGAWRLVTCLTNALLVGAVKTSSVWAGTGEGPPQAMI